MHLLSIAHYAFYLAALKSETAAGYFGLKPIHFLLPIGFSITRCLEPNPSCYSVTCRVHPGQVTSLEQS